MPLIPIYLKENYAKKSRELFKILCFLVFNFLNIGNVNNKRHPIVYCTDDMNKRVHIKALFWGADDTFPFMGFKAAMQPFHKWLRQWSDQLMAIRTEIHILN